MGTHKPQVGHCSFPFPLPRPPPPALPSFLPFFPTAFTLRPSAAVPRCSLLAATVRCQCSTHSPFVCRLSVSTKVVAFRRWSFYYRHSFVRRSTFAIRHSPPPSPPIADRRSPSFVVRRSSFVVRRSSFVVRRSSFVVRRSTFVVRRSSFVRSKFVRSKFADS